MKLIDFKEKYKDTLVIEPDKFREFGLKFKFNKYLPGFTDIDGLILKTEVYFFDIYVGTRQTNLKELREDAKNLKEHLKFAQKLNIL